MKPEFLEHLQENDCIFFNGRYMKVKSSTEKGQAEMTCRRYDDELEEYIYSDELEEYISFTAVVVFPDCIKRDIVRIHDNKRVFLITEKEFENELNKTAKFILK